MQIFKNIKVKTSQLYTYTYKPITISTYIKTFYIRITRWTLI